MKFNKWEALIFIFVFGFAGERIGILSENYLNDTIKYDLCCAVSGVLTFLASYLLYLLYKNVKFINDYDN